MIVGTCAVISPTARTNALGRAVCVADLASEVFDRVHLYAPDDGALWPGAKRSPLPVRRYASMPAMARELAADAGSLFIWAIKPLPTSWRPALALKRTIPASVAVLDVDDADEALSRQFMAASIANRLRLHRLNPLNPLQIRRTLAVALGEADALTYASEAVKDTLGIDFSGPSLCVPHPRRRAPDGQTPDDLVHGDRRIHLGFLGTVRGHKGLADIERLVASDPGHVLHVFNGSLPPRSEGRLAGQLVRHAPDEPMHRIYGEIDVVVLPQDLSPGAQAQLPAKLLDAMRFGRPVVASRTKAIVEAAADTALYVDDWGAVEHVKSAIAIAHAERSRLGAMARDRFDRSFRLEAQTDALRALVASMPAHAERVVSTSGHAERSEPTADRIAPSESGVG